MKNCMRMVNTISQKSKYSLRYPRAIMAALLLFYYPFVNNNYISDLPKMKLQGFTSNTSHVLQNFHYCYYYYCYHYYYYYYYLK